MKPAYKPWGAEDPDETLRAISSRLCSAHSELPDQDDDDSHSSPPQNGWRINAA